MFETRTSPWSKLMPPAEPLRVAMDTERIEELAVSLQDVGQLQPLVVKPYGDGPPSTPAMTNAAELDRFIVAGNQFEIIDGHRRFVAAKRAVIQIVSCTTG